MQGSQARPFSRRRMFTAVALLCLATAAITSAPGGLPPQPVGGSTFSGCSSAPGGSSTVEVTVPASGYGALTVPAQGGVTVDGQPVSYNVSGNHSSSPDVQISPPPPAGAEVCVNGYTAGGSGHPAAATLTWQ